MSRPKTDSLFLVSFLPQPGTESNRWLQILDQMRMPAPVSHWATRVTAIRTFQYDRIRQFTSRGALLAGIATLLAFADRPTPVAWALLSLGAVQTVLEIHLEGKADDLAKRRFRITRLMLALQDKWQWERTLLNVTGALGALAVPANLVAVLFCTGAGEFAWVKVAALVLVIAYGNSGIMAVFTDATIYSAHQSLPRILTAIRPYVWLLCTGVLAVAVGFSVSAGLWARDMVPLAWATCALPYLLGMRMRDYDRFLRASAEAVATAMADTRGRLVQDFLDAHESSHRLSNGLAGLGTVPEEYKRIAVDLASRTDLVTQMIDEWEWITRGKETTLEGTVQQLKNDHSLKTTTDLRLGELSADNHDLARRLIVVIITASAQAMAARGLRDRPVKVSGHVANDRIHLSITDPLPPLSPVDWPREGSALASMRNRLRSNGGNMKQFPTMSGKEIRCDWNVLPPRTERRATR